MSQVTLERLEQRVTQLENRLAELLPKSCHEPGRDDWMETVGMFSNDPIAQQIFQGALKIREAERERARNGEVE